ncbi:hypothetical protein DMENIID0001_064870 [Sergentomyia squamirostris]
MEQTDGKSPLTPPSGSDHETMDSWTFVDESKGQQRPVESSVSIDGQAAPSIEVKPDKYHLSVDQDNDTELSDGISIISDSDCGGRHTPEEASCHAEKFTVDVERRNISTETTFIHPTPPETPLSLISDEKRLVETCSDNRLVEKEDDFVRGVFGIGRRHVMMVILLAGISGAMFGHLFRAMPGPPCDCTKLIEPLMTRVYDLEVENFRLRDEVMKLTQKILSESSSPTTNALPTVSVDNTPVQTEKVWTGDHEEAIVEPLHDESICGANSGDDLFDEYYGQKCREAEQRIKEVKKAFEDPKAQNKAENVVVQKKYDGRDQKQYKEDKKSDKRSSHEDERKGKPEKYREKDEKRGSKEDRRNNSKERFDERRKKDQDWSGEENRREKMKKGERDDDSRERRNNGDRRKERGSGKKWHDDDDDDDSHEDKRKKKFDPQWQEKRMRGRQQFREKEKEGNWYLERGSSREIKRQHLDESHERHR